MDINLHKARSENNWATKIGGIYRIFVSVKFCDLRKYSLLHESLQTRLPFLMLLKPKTGNMGFANKFHMVAASVIFCLHHLVVGSNNLFNFFFFFRAIRP